MEQNKKNKTVVELPEEVTICNSEEIRNQLLELSEKFEIIVIDQGKVNEVDLTYLQILIALKKTMAEKSIKFYLINVKEDFIKLIERTGLLVINNLITK